MLLRLVMQRWPRATALALGLLGAVAIAALAEIAARARREPDIVPSWPCQVSGPRAGPNVPNCQGTGLARRGDRLLYQVPVSIDADGRRLTPQSGLEQRTRLALFLGCSFTAGVGVRNSETLPSFFGEDVPDFRVLNYGGGGFGPQHALRQLKLMTAEELGPHEGRPLLVYTMIQSHIDRAVGGYRILATFGASSPSYALQPDGSLVLEGTFLKAHPWRVLLARWMWKSALLRRLPDTPSTAGVELTARILEEARTEFSRRFGSDRFVVLAYPGSRSPAYASVLERLRAGGVAVLDPRNLFDHPEGRGARLEDRHPKAETHRQVAAWLAVELRRMGFLGD